MSEAPDPVPLLDRREAIRRVGALLGGMAYLGGAGLLAAVERAHAVVDTPGATATGGAAGGIGEFTAGQIALLDEIAETILPATRTPGAKAAKTGAFMALMVTDGYGPAERRVFVEGLKSVDDAMRRAHQVSFMQATPEQRLALLTVLDRDQKRIMDERAAAKAAHMPSGSVTPSSATAAAVAAAGAAAGAAAQAPVSAAADTATRAADTGRESDDRRDVPYFRMMKELAMLGFFTSKLGCTEVQRYIEAPGRYDPCAAYAPGEPAWASHA